VQNVNVDTAKEDVDGYVSYLKSAEVTNAYQTIKRQYFLLYNVDTVLSTRNWFFFQK
jgi:hypothetical protein